MNRVEEQTEVKHHIINEKEADHPLIKDGSVRDFLHKHLDQYGDNKADIQKAIDYIFNDRGGFIVVQEYKGKISGVVLINKTGMSGYIPENILVYVAVNRKYRGLGLGRKVMKTAIDRAEGNIALHVEKANPARFLYEKLGFKNPYLEMRLIKK